MSEPECYISARFSLNNEIHQHMMDVLHSINCKISMYVVKFKPDVYMTFYHLIVLYGQLMMPLATGALLFC